MKRVIPLSFMMLALSCAVFFPRNLQDIVQTVDDFTMERVSKYNYITYFDGLRSGSVPVFAEFGADSCLVADYIRSGERYTVEAVSFASNKGALGAFTVSDFPGSYPVELGDGARKSDKLIQFVKGPFIFGVIPARKENLTGAQALAEALSEEIDARGLKPDMYATLPKSGIVHESETFFMGPEVFKKHFPGKLVEELEIKNIREGYTAQYMTDDGITKFLKLKYYDTGAAKSAVNAYIKSRSERPVILPRESLKFYTIVESDRSETYIADYAEWVYFMPGTPTGRKSQGLFEYIMRGGK